MLTPRSKFQSGLRAEELQLAVWLQCRNRGFGLHADSDSICFSTISLALPYLSLFAEQLKILTKITVACNRIQYKTQPNPLLFAFWKSQIQAEGKPRLFWRQP